MLIWQEHQPRGTWKTGRILELIPSEDGKIRSAKIQLPDKKALKRSVTQLYPLECHLDQDNLDVDNADNLDHGVDLDPEIDGQVDKNYQELPRLGRKAKDNAKVKISKLLGGNVSALP